MSTLENVKVFEFPKVSDPRGNLTFIEEAVNVPFEIKRVFYIYDIPGGVTRGGHGHKINKSVLVAITGSMDLHLSDGYKEIVITLNRANKGVLIPEGVWVSMQNFSSGTILLAMNSEYYDEEEYIRDFAEFKRFVKTYNPEP
ncbi:MAG: FdtA/QdtA family cupin domain-containing protein [Muribaculaceae bacterium]|nr:FdtA/QdtA family cupin domain-containing protein [Muribaculaceae bacterium]MDE6559076.1 FdtA/QdtA family cupin domain-containing protein [Muribaculaceae bacterium]